MKMTISPLDRASATVSVTFVHAGVTFTRPVNACLAADGSHDRKATVIRCEEVARGVQAKIEAGHIRAAAE